MQGFINVQQFKRFRGRSFCESGNGGRRTSDGAGAGCGGLPIMELVFRSFAHSRAIRRIAKEMPDFIIGAGNILNKDQLVRAIDSSARFAFSPVRNRK